MYWWETVLDRKYDTDIPIVTVSEQIEGQVNISQREMVSDDVLHQRVPAIIEARSNVQCRANAVIVPDASTRSDQRVDNFNSAKQRTKR